MTRDVLDTLDAIHPEQVQLDEPWARDTLAGILATRVEPVARRRRRRLGTAMAGAVAVGVIGAGAAAAGGLSPQSFVDAFRSWGMQWRESEPGSQPVDPATAQRVADAPGPGGTRFTLVSAPGREGFACVAVLFETPASAAAPLPSDFVDANGSSCHAPPPADARFGDLGAVDVQRQPGALGERDVRVLSISGGSAIRAEIRTADGQAVPMLRFGGRFYGWFVGQGDATRPAVLIGFAADGTEVGRTRL